MGPSPGPSEVHVVLGMVEAMGSSSSLKSLLPMYRLGYSKPWHVIPTYNALESNNGRGYTDHLVQPPGH